MLAVPPGTLPGDRRDVSQAFVAPALVAGMPGAGPGATEVFMNWLFYGYLAAWTVHLVYLLTITARQREIGREIESLRRVLDSREKQQASTM